MSPSPIPKFDNPKMHMNPALQLFGAGREKRIYAIPPYTPVRSLDFEDHPFEVQRWDACLRAVRLARELPRRNDRRRRGQAPVRLLRQRLLRRAPRCRPRRQQQAVEVRDALEAADERTRSAAGRRRRQAVRAGGPAALGLPRRALRPVSGRSAGGRRRIGLGQDHAAQAAGRRACPATRAACSTTRVPRTSGAADWPTWRRCPKPGCACWRAPTGASSSRTRATACAWTSPAAPTSASG